MPGCSENKLLLFFILLLTIILLPACDRTAGSVPEDVHLEQVGPFSAVIAWTTQTEARFIISWGEGSLLDRRITEEDGQREHRLALTGLKPRTRYSYRIEPGGFSASFRSAPGLDGAFDLVVLDSSSPACQPSQTEIELDPDIVILFGECQGKLARKPESILTIDARQNKTDELSLGRWLIRILPALPATWPDKPDDKRLILVLPKLPETPPTEAGEALLVSPGGTLYQDRRQEPQPPKTVWLEIDSFEVAWVGEGEQGRSRQVIIEAPPESKKSCLYCDRLLESGRYLQSIAWYQDFIAENKNRHEIEDALLAIAGIYDEKLFDYKMAVVSYMIFLTRYPESRKAVLARHRLQYISSHSDDKFQPLARFEKVKAELVRSDPEPAIAEVEKLIADQPDASIVPVALFWLGNLLEQTDGQRAAGHYGQLIKLFPDSENAAVAAIALGDILYRAKSYQNAVKAYQDASRIVPTTYRISVEDKIRKSKRNIWRELGRYGAWIVLAGWLLLSIRLRARPTGRDLSASLVILLGMVLVGGVYFTIYYRETGILIPVVSALALTSFGVILWNRPLAARRGLAAWIVLAHAVSCWTAAAYLIMYHLHYIYVFGL